MKKVFLSSLTSTINLPLNSIKPNPPTSKKHPLKNLPILPSFSLLNPLNPPSLPTLTQNYPTRPLKKKTISHPFLLKSKPNPII